MKRILGESVSRLVPAADTLDGAARACRGPGSRVGVDQRIDRVEVSYSGSTNIGDNGDYVRIDGPRVWIAFRCQGEDHYHTIWRDRVTDHGAGFSF